MNRNPLIIGATFLALLSLCVSKAPAQGDLDFRVPSLPEAFVALEGEGPHGGDIRGIIPTGSGGWILWTADAGPFIREAGEERWRPASEGLPVTNGRILVTAMAACESRPGFIAAAFLDGWLFASQDGGRSWEIIGLVPARGETVRELIIHPGDPDRIMAATRRKVFMSEDQGRSWTELLHPMNLEDPRGWNEWSLQFVDLLVNRLRPGTALFVTRDQGTLLTNNWGNDLGWLRDNLPGPVDAAALDPTIGTIAYAVAGGDLYRSVDGGETWEVIAWSGRGVLGRVSSLIVDPGQPSRLLALIPGQDMLKVSDDGGLTWETAELPAGEEAQALAVHPLGADLGLLLGTNMGLWESLDGGRSWRPSSSGIEDVTVLNLIPSSEEPTAFFVATDRGLALIGQREGGWNWSGDWWSTVPVERVLHADPEGVSVWVLAGDDVWNLSQDGTMNPLLFPEAELQPTDAAWWRGGLWICGTSSESLWVARRDGEGSIRIRSVAGRDEQVLDPWLLVDPCDGDGLFLGYGPLLESSDGETWTEVTLPQDVKWVWDTGRIANRCGDLLLATDKGIFLRPSDTRSWQGIGPGEFDIQQIVMDPLDEDRWFARAFGLVYLTEDGGETWKTLDLPRGQVTAMSWEISSERLLVGLRDEGIRWVNLGTEQGLGVRLEPINVSPNPFRDEAVVSFEVRDPVSSVELRIYSVFGDHVRTVRREIFLSSGDLFRWTWDGTSDDGQRVAAGVYVFRATLAGRSYGGKALHMR